MLFAAVYVLLLAHEVKNQQNFKLSVANSRLRPDQATRRIAKITIYKSTES